MSLAIKYETVDDARMRLRSSVVLYKNKPVLVREVTNGPGGDDIFRVKFDELPVVKERPVGEWRPGGIAPHEADAEKRKFISSKFFDIAPFRMGYVNHSGPEGVFYCSRMPNRIQKQGLCNENFSGVLNDGRAISFTTFLTSKEVPAMIAGEYPSFDKALNLMEKVSAVAFSRDFCLVKDDVIPDLLFLYHKGKKTGYVGKGEAVLSKKFLCLKEALEEMHVKVGVC